MGLSRREYFRSTKELIQIIRGDGTETRADGYQWLLDLPVALFILPWDIVVEIVMTPYFVLKGYRPEGW